MFSNVWWKLCWTRVGGVQYEVCILAAAAGIRWQQGDEVRRVNGQNLRERMSPCVTVWSHCEYTT
jgi:hypothetical protein